MIEIIAYTKVDGIRTFKDSVIKGIYNKIIENGDGYIFNDGSITSAEDFLYVMKNKAMLFIAYLNSTPVAIIWLTRFENKSARLHWCDFKNMTIRDAIRIGKYFLKYIMSIKYANGDYMFNVIIGHTPVSNKRAIQYAKLTGMNMVAEIPYLHWNSYDNVGETCAISYYVRGEEYENL